MKQAKQPKDLPYDYEPLFEVTTPRIDKRGSLRGYNTYYVGIVTVTPCGNCECYHVVYKDKNGLPYVRCYRDQSAQQKYTEFAANAVVGWAPWDAKRALRCVLVDTDARGEDPRTTTKILSPYKASVQESCKAHMSSEDFESLMDYFDRNPGYRSDLKCE